MHKHQQGVSFQLSVVGKDSIDVRLDKNPANVSVYFTDDNTAPVPCNPKQIDSLSWDVNRVVVGGFHEWHLTISWDVSGPREIEWTVKY